MITRREKMLLHIYANAAGLEDHQYRHLLRKTAGVPSAADGEMTQAGFERCMAAVETTLFDRVDRGVVSDPIGHSRHIMNRWYWRRKLPSEGRINSRQYHLISELWSTLMPRLPADCQNTAYLAGIIRKATGKSDLCATALTMAEAGFVIDALQDRLCHAVGIHAHA